jgi:RecB family exonuclease
LKLSRALRELSETERAARLRDIATRVAQSDMPTTTVHRQRLIELEVELAVQWIMALLRVEAQRESFTVHQTERREQLQVASMQLNIQLDRIDKLPDGSWLLIDYKTGASNHAKDWLDIAVPNRPRSPQLPLYALAHRQNLAGIAYAVLSPGESGFRGLANRARVIEGVEHYDARKPRQRVPGVDTWEDLLRHWQEVLNSLAASYLGGEARVDPLKGECDYCHLAGLCRVRELVEQAGEDEEDADE